MDKINEESMKKVYEENYRTFLKKNTDYGSSFEESLDEFGEVAGIVRIIIMKSLNTWCLNTAV